FPAHQAMFYEKLRTNQEHLLTKPIPNLTRLTQVLHANKPLEAVVIPVLLDEWPLFTFYVLSNTVLMSFLENFPDYVERTLERVADHEPDATGPLVDNARDLCRLFNFAPDILRRWVRNICLSDIALISFFPNLESLIELTRYFPETTVG